MIPVGIRCFDRVKPTVAITNPTSGTQQGTITMTVSTADNDQIAGCKFFIDGAQYGAEVTSAPFQVSVNTAALSSGAHSSYAIVRDRVGNTTQSATTNWSARDQHPPSVSITNPGNGATVYDTVTFQASPSDDVGISYVQFNMDGSGWTGAIGAPYQWAYDTHNLGVGWHTIYCLATDTTGNQTQTQISFYVNNQPPGGSYILDSYYIHGGDQQYSDRWVIDYYPNFHPEGGYFDRNDYYLPGNPNPTYYQMRGRLYAGFFESPDSGAWQYVGLWLNADYPAGPNVQISTQYGQNDNYSGFFNLNGGERCHIDRWGDRQDGCYTQRIRVYYDFVPKYAS